MRRYRQPISALLVSLLVFWQVSPSLIAATVYWDGSTDGAWATAANWNTAADGSGANVTFANNNDLVFITTGGINLTQTLGANRTVRSLSFNSNLTAPLAISGSTLTIAPTGAGLTPTGTGIDMSAAGADVTIGSTITLGGDQTWLLGAGRTLTVTSAFTADATDDLILDGAGTLSLGNTTDNNFQIGSITLQNGANLLNTQDNPFGDTTTAIIMNAGTTWDKGGFTDAFKAISGTGGSVINAGNLDFRSLTGESNMFSGTVTAAAGNTTADLIKQGQGNLGTQIIAGDVDFKDQLLVYSGTLGLEGASGAANQVGTTLTNGVAVLLGRTDASTVRDAGVPMSTLLLDSTVANHAAQNRLRDDSEIEFRSTGHLKLIGNAAAMTTENVGVLDVAESNFADTHAVVTLQDGGAGITLTANGLLRSLGSTLLVRGNGLGTAAAGAGVTNLIFDVTVPSITGVAGTPTVGILQGVFGDTSASGTGTGLTTYGTNGVRLLTSAEYAATFSGAGENVSLTANQTLSGALTDLTATLAGAGVTLDLGAATLTLANASIVSNGTAAGTISNGSISFGAATEGIIYTPQDLTLNASIIGSAALTKAGIGKLTLSAAQTYTGMTSITQGSVDVTGSFILPATRLNVDNATLNFTGAGAYNRTGLLSGSWNSTVNLNDTALELVGLGTDISYFGQLNGSASSTLIKTGGNIWTQRSLNSSFLGNVIVRSGTFRLLGDTSTSTSPAAGTLTGAASFLVETGGTLSLDNQTATDTRSISNRIGDTATVTLNRGTFVITGNNSARPSETIGSMVLQGAYNTITLDADFGSNTDTNTSHGDVVLTAGTLVRQNSATALVRGDNLGFAIGGIADDATAANTTGGSAGDPGGAESNLKFTTAPTLSGAGTGSAIGIIPYLTGGVSAGSSGSSLVTYDATTGIRLLDFSPTTTDYAFRAVSTATNLTASTLSGNNVYIDITANSSDAILDANVTIGGLVLDNTGGTASDLNLNGNTLTIAGGALLSTGSYDNEVLAGGVITFGDNLATGYEGYINGVRPININALITDNGANSVSLTTDNTVYLQNNNTYTGPTVINSGRIETVTVNALPVGTLLTVNGAGALRLFGGSQEIGGLQGIGFVENQHATIVRALTINTDTVSDNFTFSGVLRNGAAAVLELVKTGPGTQQLAGLVGSTATGTVTVQDGRLVLDGGMTADSGLTYTDNRLATTVPVVLGSGSSSGILQIGGVTRQLNQTIGSLATAGSGTTNTIVGGNSALSTLTIDQASNTTFIGNLGGAGTNENNLSISKTGAGELIVTGNASYAGTTSVTNGKLILNGTHNLDGAITVGPGELRVSGAGLLGGSSGSSITVNNGGSFILNDGNTNQTFGGTGNILTLNQSTLTTQVGFGLIGATSDRITLGSGQTLSITGLIDTVIVVGSSPTVLTDRGYLLIDSAVDGAFTGTGSFQIGAIENAGNFIYNVAREVTGTDPDRLYLTVTANTTPPPNDAWWKGDLTGPAAGSWTAVQLGGSSNWDTSESGGVDAAVPPGANSHVHFSATGGANFATQLLSTLTIKALTFHAGSGTNGVSIAGTGPLTIGNGTDTPSLNVLTSGNDAITISAPVLLGAAQSWNIEDGSAVLTVSGGISGTGGLSLNDNGTASGTLLLTTTSSAYSGATSVSAGRLALEGINRLPITTDLTLGSATRSAILQLGTATAAASTTIGNLLEGAASGSSIVGGNAASSILTVVQSTVVTFDGVIGGIGTNENNIGITKDGDATLTLNGANTYAGATTVTEGTLDLGATGSIAGSAGINVIADAGTNAIFDVNGRTAVLSAGVTLGGSDGTATARINDTATGGLITLGGNVTYLAANNPLGATINANLSNGGNSRTFTVEDSSNATTDLTLNGTFASSNSATITGAGTMTVNANWTLAGTNLSITKTGNGILNLNAITNATGTGDWNISGGTVNATVTNALNANDNIIVTGTGLADSVILNISGTAGTSGVHQGNDFYIRAGARVNVSTTNGISTGTDSILIGDSASIATPGVLDLQSADINVGANGLLLGASGGQTGNIIGDGVITTVGGYTLRNGLIEDGITLAGGSLTKIGDGTVTFYGTRTAGNTNIQEGHLILDYSTNNSSKIAGVLTLGATTQGNLTTPISLVIEGSDSAATIQAVSSTTMGTTGHVLVDINAGTGQTATLELGAITHSIVGSTVNFDYSSSSAKATTTAAAVPALGYATVTTGGTTRIAGVDAAGTIIQASTTTGNDSSLWVHDANIINTAGYTGTVASCAVIQSLTFDAAAASAIAIDSGNALIINSGGILVNSTVGANASVISGGSIYGSNTSPLGEITVHQHNAAAPLTISSNIVQSSGIAKSGAGELAISGSNTFVPNSRLTINEGTVSISGGSALDDSTSILMRANTVLNINSSETVGNLDTSGGTISIATGQTLTLNQTAASTVTSAITGAGNLVKNGTGILTLTGTSTRTGTTTINGGNITLSGAAGMMNGSTAFILNGASLVSDQNDATERNRISNSAAITLNNTAGTNGLMSTTNQGNTKTEDVGAVTLGAGHNTLTAYGSVTSAISNLSVDSLTRSGRATALVRGNNLGTAASTTRGQIIVNVAAGNTAIEGQEIGGGGAAGSTSMSIIPWLVGDSSQSGLGNSFVTNTGTTNGLRPLTAAEYKTDEADFNALAAATPSTDNVRFATNPSATLTGTPSAINSLVFDSTAAITATAATSTSIEITTGAILAANTGNHAIDGFSSITTGGGSDYTVYVTTSASTFTIGSPLTTTVPLVKSGAGTLSLTSNANTFTDVFINQGAILINNPDKLGTGSLNFDGGILRLASGFSGALGSKVVNLLTGGGTIDTNGINTTVTDIAITGTTSLTKAGSGTLTLAGTAATTHAGQTVLTGGSLALAKTVGTNAIGTGGIWVQGLTNGGTVTLSNIASEQIADTATVTMTNNGGTPTGGAVWNLNAQSETIANLDMSTVSTSATKVNIASGGMLTVTGSINLNHNRAATGNSSSHVEITGAGTLNLGGGQRIITVESNNTAANLPGSDADIDTVITNGGIIKQGSRTLYLKGANTYSGVTDIQQGTVSISTSAGLGDASATNTIRIANGTLQSTGANVNLTANRSIELDGVSAIIDVTGTNVLTAPALSLAMTACLSPKPAPAH
ncbi:MAG: autotransporter-associated beta strand repeat-containing protein [Verrucomicrobiaceae bacterium]|nr:autotransporter-associated beta strand repeat-containing protein [Verrucomicrobiaceae bacterium]